MSDFYERLKSNRIYTIDEVDIVCKHYINKYDIVKSGSFNKELGKMEYIEYYNIPCSFDIETTSFIDEFGNKAATMYVWQLGLNGCVIVGRTWEEYIQVINRLAYNLSLWSKRRIILYVHNLSYEFQFIRNLFTWIDDGIFSIDKRVPIYAISTQGIEYRCSYILSGYNLEKLGDNLTKYKINKAVGLLDYNTLRHSETPLSKDELLYCVNDVKVVMAHIQECIDNEENITTIPLTKTGYVRRFCRNKCLLNNKSNKFKNRNSYAKFIKGLVLSSEEYSQLKKAFQGGFTHANAMGVNLVHENVASYDFTSSYPAVLLSEKFPMSVGVKYKPKNMSDFRAKLNNYCCMFTITYSDITLKKLYDAPISSSKCEILENAVIDNGRVASATKLKTTITEQDFFIYEEYYDYHIDSIESMYIYEKSYLPFELISCIIELYQKKTTLKGVEDKVAEYQSAKADLNSIYGMMVTDIVRDIITYGEKFGWSSKTGNIIEDIDKVNNSKNRFIFYPWGVWCTAYARRNLFSGISEFKEDYLCSDTDSLKVCNYKLHLTYINKYNDNITQKIHNMCDYYQIPYSDVEPKTIKGESKPIGVWDFEGVYSKFKTLGAKRYMYIDSENNQLHTTIAGLPKVVCKEYLSKLEEPFEFFQDDMTIDKEHSHKLCSTYIDNPIDGVLTDYLGNKAEYHEKSAINLSPIEFTLSMSETYVNYILDIKERIL